MTRRNVPNFTAETSLSPRGSISLFPATRQRLGRALADSASDRRDEVIPQWTTLRCPNDSLQTICSLAFYPADLVCASSPWSWFNHGAEIGCAYGIMVAHFPWCAPCAVT